ncbi:hypothetical protein K435DRAFT_800194 [Dendrothele bispora CBS 962.96]|uniref:Uncharacterized protein n=1 Tax=Dendrothele bispora (strain CBS 962.96) TaxID=1314807 RepID=A0A4S8LTB8_DENBC|nr:hypothetical protein K435DRAFT_800194 [Dendrothele bispora CBS 962.96]
MPRSRAPFYSRPPPVFNDTGAPSATPHIIAVNLNHSIGSGDASSHFNQGHGATHPVHDQPLYSSLYQQPPFPHVSQSTNAPNFPPNLASRNEFTQNGGLLSVNSPGLEQNIPLSLTTSSSYDSVLPMALDNLRQQSPQAGGTSAPVTETTFPSPAIPRREAHSAPRSTTLTWTGLDPHEMTVPQPSSGPVHHAFTPHVPSRPSTATTSSGTSATAASFTATPRRSSMADSKSLDQPNYHSSSPIPRK